MKRFFPVIISLILICSTLFTGCNNNNETTVSSKDSLEAFHDLLTESLLPETETTTDETEITFKQFSSVLSSWADGNNIDVQESNDNYIVLSKGSSGEIKNVESFTFHSAIDLSSISAVKTSLSNSAIIMAILNDASNHGDLNAIFTMVKDGQPVGSESLASEYLECDNFIDIAYDKNTTLYNTFAAISDMTATKELTITQPQYTKAFEIKFEGKQNQSAYKNRGHYPNPIKTIGDLLASSQTSTILFELTSFNGGTNSDQIPSEATANIVLHENDVESFTKKFDNSYKKVAEMYEDVDEEFTYTLTPVDLPEEVICKEDTEKIVSLMYTMINGTYSRNESDETQAVSNMGIVSTTDGMFKMDINAKSLSDEIMTELETVIKTICGLSNIDYTKQNGTALWTNDSELISTLSTELAADCSGILELKHVTKLIEKNPEINLVTLGTNLDDAKKDIDKIVEYMTIAGIEIVPED